MPGAHTNGDALPDAGDIIQSHVSGVMNVTGKPAGVYEYIFVSTSNDGFCGMSNGEQSVVRIYLVPQPVSFPVLTNVCPGTRESIDFNKFIPPEMKYFIDEMGWTLSYTLDGKSVNLPVIASLSNVGNNVYRYTINDGSGPFMGKYLAMKSSAYFCPEDSAYLTHTVRIRENEEYAIPDKEISFCTEVLGLVPETSTVLTTDLFGYLGSSAPNGKWSIEYKGNLNSSDIPINETSGVVKIPIALLTMFYGTPAQIDSVVFKYSYKDCMEKDTFTLLTFNFNSTKFAGTFVEQERDVCRNLTSGVVELSSIFGFTVPLTSGVWNQETEDGKFEEMLYGAVDISEMHSGSLYTFRYDVNSSVDALCMIQGSSTLFHLRMHDLEVANAEVKICKKQFGDGVTIDLSRYVPGLNDAERISPERITWRDTAGVVISNPNRYTLKSTAAWQTADTSLYTMQYQYEVRSDCGPYTGNLYISAVDSLSSKIERKIIICYTDDYASHVDIFQILGIVGATGSFSLCDDPVNEKGQKIPQHEKLNDVVSTGIMDASDMYDTNNESETYTFCYLPGRNEPCVPDDIKVTVIITKNVRDNSEFK
jgi:hypothetical protein